MMKTFFRLLKLSQPYWFWVIISVMLGAATVCSAIGLMATSGYLIAMAALQPSIADLQVAIVGVRFFGISRGFFRYFERRVSHVTTFKILSRLRIWFYSQLEPLAPARLLQYPSGDLYSRILADIETLEQFFSRTMAPPLVAMVVVLLAGLLMAYFRPTLAWILIFGLLCVGLLLPWLSRKLTRRTGRQFVEARALEYVTLIDGIQGIAELLIFNAAPGHTQITRDLNRMLLQLQMRMAKIETLSFSISGLVIDLTVIGLLILAIPLVNGGELTGIDLTVLLLATIASFEAVLPLPSAFQKLEKSLTAAERLFDVIDQEPVIRDPIKPLSKPQSFDLHIEGLRFRYEPKEPLALDDLSFRLKEGDFMAVAGSSGAGKSTIVNLLLRFWEYGEGRILLGGNELRKYRSEDVRSRLAVHYQQTQLFNGTIRHNLLLANPDAEDHEIEKAARAAQIHDFILSLPLGYETWIGEGGLRLSAGERQRVALARTFLIDAPILILDEPSANLDAITERALLEALNEVAQGRTTLLISHRLVGMEMADEILVLSDGCILEHGSHEELLKAEGLYRRMWELQMQADVIEAPQFNSRESSP